MRAITQAAGASLSAANYHFGSKEGLLRATLLRRVEPVNRERLACLDALEAQARGSDAAPPLESVIDAFLRPALEARAASRDASDRYRLVAARLYSDPPEVVNPPKVELFSAVGERFLAALRRALPGRDERELGLAWQFSIGVMVHAMAGHLDPAPGLPFDFDELSVDAVLARMTAYVAAGVRAASSSGEPTAPVGDPP